MHAPDNSIQRTPFRSFGRYCQSFLPCNLHFFDRVAYNFLDLSNCTRNGTGESVVEESGPHVGSAGELRRLDHGCAS